ncbi:hypothetical protein E0485_19310 [Paenibacillus albiflavus]|uniref:Uncharacterized protein n=1 Tax=Paenibacillus albiflavus TaxID=2545760 RepID=A0A4R4E518_9BACL|nr:hypothetical protein [Paenibacillus albiflavus]TCZ74716.1 hypothetical protein E0485_19310 [Paenibacillus albiflavus]
MKKNSFRLYYLVWLIGAIILIVLGNQLLDYFNESAKRTFDYSWNVWGPVFIYFIFGVYLGFLNGLPKKISFNKSLFVFVFIPSLFMSLYFILMFYYKLPFAGAYMFHIRQNVQFIFNIIAGMSFIVSVFSLTRLDKNN